MASSMVSPSEIDDLSRNAPYEITTLQRLEVYLRQQLSSQQYSFEANHLLMKNYQIHSKYVNIDNISQILIISLMGLPSTDYLALSYMIPISVANHPNIISIANCANYLERAKFREFWVEFSSAPPELFHNAVGFVGGIRAFILNCLANSFKNVPLPTFLELLGLPNDEIQTFMSISPRALQLVDGNIVFKAAIEYQPVPKYDETLKVDELLRIVDTIREMNSSD